MKKLNLLLLTQLIVVLTFGQYNLKGIVTGSGEPLSGASVVVKNTFYGTSTNSDGSFEFKNLKKGDYELTVSFIGFETQNVNITLNTDREISVKLKPDMVMTGEIMVAATRVKEKSPFAYSNVTSDEIKTRNLGQDIPYLLQLTPSFVATSDAGAGVGYTNFRIRGTDLNRINVTINGIPLNDPESHGTWFVDQPDLASSLENIQIQRGVGTSTNGAAAFGATINLQTNTLKKDAYAEYNTSFGSFNTFKNTVCAGTGLLNGKFTVDVRLSKVSSDGFVDRAFSNLKSFFVSGGYYTENTVLKINVFSGFEETYQAWNGIPSEILKIDRTYNSAGYYLDSDGNDRYYENQVDHYQQDHYQLHFSHKFNTNLNINLAVFYIYGRGYYENYETGQDFTAYQLPYPVVGKDTVFSTDLVNRKWLDNDFYGVTYALNYQKGISDFTFGGGWNTYDGNHFGNIIWAQYLGNVKPNYEWYRNKGIKKDGNIYAKYNLQAAERLNLFADLQYRWINYTIDGIDHGLRNITQEDNFSFFNPKLGVFYQPAGNQKLYFSYAAANREPNRDNYVDADPEGKQPVPEILHDWEMGYNISSSRYTVSTDMYFMNYKNQLVLTGEINDVGAPIMVNVDKSYRAGIELQAGVKISRILQWNGNATFSQNKIKNFTEYVDKYNDSWEFEGQDAINLGTTNLSFSPNVIANSLFSLAPTDKLNISLVSSYVGKQYIDNTSNNDRILKAYFVNNLKADYAIKTKLFNAIILHLQVNNLFNEKYESNAWVYSYILGGERYKMDGYFPQAGPNFLFGADFRF